MKIITDIDTEIKQANGHPHAFLARINKSQATKMLDCWGHNRSLSPAAIARYLDDMNNNRWLVTSQGIGIDVNGQGCDGQHRLTAFTKSDKETFDTIMAVNLPPDAKFKAIDQGKSRTHAHCMQMYINDTPTSNLANRKFTPFHETMFRAAFRYTPDTAVRTAFMREQNNHKGFEFLREFGEVASESVKWIDNLLSEDAERAKWDATHGFKVLWSVILRAHIHYSESGNTEAIQQLVRLIDYAISYRPAGIPNPNTSMALVLQRNMAQYKVKARGGDQDRMEIYRKVSTIVKRFMNNEIITPGSCRIHAATVEEFPIPFDRVAAERYSGETA